MTNPFDQYGYDKEETRRWDIVDQFGDPIVDDTGTPMFVELYAPGSQHMQDYYKARKEPEAKLSALNGGEESNLERGERILRQMAHAFKSWHLVDLKTRAPLDIPLTSEDAYQLLSSDAFYSIITRPLLKAWTDPKSFLVRPVKESSSAA